MKRLGPYIYKTLLPNTLGNEILSTLPTQFFWMHRCSCSNLLPFMKITFHNQIFDMSFNNAALVNAPFAVHRFNQLASKSPSIWSIWNCYRPHCPPWYDSKTIFPLSGLQHNVAIQFVSRDMNFGLTWASGAFSRVRQVCVLPEPGVPWWTQCRMASNSDNWTTLSMKSSRGVAYHTHACLSWNSNLAYAA
jgi:hypothetical protein